MPERRLFHPFRPFSRLTLAALAAVCLILPGPLSDFVPDVQSLLAPSAQAADIAVFGGSGGDMGGDAALFAGTLTAAGTLNVYSGGRDTTCATNPGTGGYASVTAATLATSSIHLSKNNGNLAFNVTTLDVTSGDTLILLADTAATTSAPGAGDNGVYIGTAKRNAAIVIQSLSEKRTPDLTLTARM